jgi:hypothetical protein
MKDETKIKEALNIAASWSQIDGGHHKAWTIDQMVRMLVGGSTGSTPEYEKWVREVKEWDEDIQAFYYDWDEGIAP